MVKITMLLIGKPSISMGHLYHGYVSHNQRVTIWIFSGNIQGTASLPAAAKNSTQFSIESAQTEARSSRKITWHCCQSSQKPARRFGKALRLRHLFGANAHLTWLVVLTILKNMKVNGKDYPIYYVKNLPLRLRHLFGAFILNGL